jgi:REP element-mobilizing transposase RayT
MVFAVENRIALINLSWENQLYKYITGIIQNYDHKLITINGMSDHLHVLIGMRPTQALSDLMQNIKRDSSLWINDNNFTREKFRWQEGYGAFSYSRSQLPEVIKYIENQKLHHQKKSFLEEYVEFLEKFEVPYDERYIFKEVLS